MSMAAIRSARRAPSKLRGVCTRIPIWRRFMSISSPADSARERLTRAEKLASMAPGNVEGALALARAAIDAQILRAGADGAGATARRADAARRCA